MFVKTPLRRIVQIILLMNAVALAATGALASPGTGPQIDSLSETILPRSGRLLIFGSGFGPAQGTSDVRIDGLKAIATTWTATEIHAYVPEPTGLGAVTVQVTTAGGSSNAKALNVTVRPAGGVASGAGDRVRWRFQMDSRFSGRFIATAADGTVYASDISRIYALAPDGGLLWVASSAGGRRPISLAADGTIYATGNLIKAINPDGTLKWEFPDPFPGSGLVAGPNVGPDGNIYAAQDTFHGGGLGPFSLDPDGNLRFSDPDNGLIGAWGGSNSDIVFGADRFYVGNVTQAGTPPLLTAFDFDGDQLWSSHSSDLHLMTGTFPKMDPMGRVIVGWGQTALQALTPDGNVDWLRFHPEQMNLPRIPAIDADGVIYTAGWLGMELWALNPDGSTRWALSPSGGILDTLNVPPDGSMLLAGGIDTFGHPGWARAYDTADGALMWQVDLPTELGFNQYVNSQQPTFTPDSQTSYFTTAFLSDVGYSYVYAIDLSTDMGIQGDVDGDGSVGFSDLLTLLARWGHCAACESCPADLDGDCTVGFADLIVLLAHWG